MKTIAVYGSLKKGRYNHPILQDSEHVKDIKITGTLYSLGSYPAIVEDGDNEYDAEVYEVSEDVYRRVRDMEIGAGYKEVDIDGAIVYYADDWLAEQCKQSLKVIESY